MRVASHHETLNGGQRQAISFKARHLIAAGCSIFNHNRAIIRKSKKAGLIFQIPSNPANYKEQISGFRQRIGM
jgi:predicted nuclease of restriction endonuclease-like RecB superfamily